MIFGLLAVALLDLPEPVIIPGQDVVRVGFERTLVPDLREPVVTELAVGIADQVGDIGVVVMAERLELIDRRRVIVAVIDRRIGRMISLNEGGIGQEGLLGRLLGPVSRRAAVGRRVRAFAAVPAPRTTVSSCPGRRGSPPPAAKAGITAAAAASAPAKTVERHEPGC